MVGRTKSAAAALAPPGRGDCGRREKYGMRAHSDIRTAQGAMFAGFQSGVLGFQGVRFFPL